MKQDSVEHIQEEQVEAGQDQVSVLYREHAVTLIRMAVLLVGDQASAEDVVQDAFFGLYRGWPGLRDQNKALAYLRAAVLNGCRSVLRARRRARLIGALQHDPPVWSAESAALAKEDTREVLAALARLPRRQHEVLVLKYYLNLTEPEIATALRIARGTVASTASRALARLVAELQEDK